MLQPAPVKSFWHPLPGCNLHHSDPAVSLRSTTGYRIAFLPDKGLAWLCWSSPEANPSGIGQECPRSEKSKMRTIPLFADKQLAGSLWRG